MSQSQLPLPVTFSLASCYTFPTFSFLISLSLSSSNTLLLAFSFIFSYIFACLCTLLASFSFSVSTLLILLPFRPDSVAFDGSCRARRRYRICRPSRPCPCVCAGRPGSWRGHRTYGSTFCGSRVHTQYRYIPQNILLVKTCFRTLTDGCLGSRRHAWCDRAWGELLWRSYLFPGGAPVQINAYFLYLLV